MLGCDFASRLSAWRGAIKIGTHPFFFPVLNSIEVVLLQKMCLDS